MTLRALSLYQFRNFAAVERLEFPEVGLLVAAAPNATGKTNFLESLVVLLRGKSFRGALEECVSWGAHELAVEGRLSRAGEEARLTVRYDGPRRKITLQENGEAVSPVVLYGRYPLVTFLPEDTFLFARGPSLRRNFFNHVLISRPAYLAALVAYQRALKQRNAALKTAQSWNEVEGWTRVLSEQAGTIWQERRGLTDFLASHLPRLYQDITGEARELTARFSPGAAHPEDFQRDLEADFASERRYHYTLSGPHRDDLEIRSEGRGVQTVLSQGQMRGLTVALKLANFQFLRQVTGETPLLLLDEVLSELDQERQEELLVHLPQEAQTLLTCTRVPKILKDRRGVHLLDLRKILEKGQVARVQPYAAEPVRVPA